MKNLPYIGLLAFLLVVVTGCERPGDAVGTVVTGTAHSADGAAIAYDVRGKGDITLVFIHGWACDRSFWREQLDIFARDYRVVALDLGGHGDSQVDRDAWSLAVLGGDVQAVADELNLNRVILIGHSLGGMVSLEAARLMPERVLGVVGVDTTPNYNLTKSRFRRRWPASKLTSRGQWPPLSSRCFLSRQILNWPIGSYRRLVQPIRKLYWLLLSTCKIRTSSKASCLQRSRSAVSTRPRVHR